jgi:hypothetical protein
LYNTTGEDAGPGSPIDGPILLAHGRHEGVDLLGWEGADDHPLITTAEENVEGLGVGRRGILKRPHYPITRGDIYEAVSS